MRLHFKHLSVIAASVVLIGCGGGGGGGGLSAHDIAIAKIAAYATGTSTTAPSAADYHAAGITVINDDNVNKMNIHIQATKSSNPDDWTKDSDGDGTIDGIDDYPDDKTRDTNEKPVATAQTLTLEEDSNKTFILGGTDTEGDMLTYTITTQPSHGTISGNNTYTSNANYNGTDSFGFKAYDGTSYSAEATVTINITAVNDAPVAAGQNITVTYETATPVILSGSDVDGDTLHYSVISSPEHGTLGGTAPNLTYTPNNGYKGLDKIAFKINDGTVDSNTETVSLTVTDDPDAIYITDDYQVESLGKATNIHKNIHLDSGSKSLYILLSNYSKTQSASSTITHNAKVVSVRENKRLMIAPLVKQPKILHAPAYIQEFNSKIKTLLQKNRYTPYQAKSITLAPKLNKNVGDSETFYMGENSDDGNTTTATLKKVVSNVATAFGNKTLNVWVSDDSFGSGCGKSRCVTQTMVDELADTFLKAGDDNDIYDWVTNIFGEEWGSDATSKYNDLIGENDQITILLTDIGNNNKPSGGVMGYFWSKDNVKKSSISGSNERIMFYVDAVMFANTDNDDFWQKEMYSTLAHEFQHMIHFYQKTILLLDANSDDTWINEMLSETTEDLVATKIQHIGSRGVVYTDGSAGSAGNTNGRYPLFNENNMRSLTTWNSALEDYSQVNAFGTFLTRNYGGAKVLHDTLYNNKVHEDAIMDAIHKIPGQENKTFDDLLREWGIAVMLSDHENLQNTPVYNTGDFTPDTYGNSTYQLGSINFFNYDPQPTLRTNTGTVQPQGNYYYKVGDNLTGTVTIDLTLNGTTEATLIVK
ncbi:Ig-like domain-containing protein [Sulfurovum sp.]|uniref:M30 family zinc metallopeptidase n=1 Tax=Sulfurovum sp. TaxID=1969726 RepID=UPI0025F5258D|nr:Ig-like domain-containing protein [Sulfurovum sp.]